MTDFAFNPRTLLALLLSSFCLYSNAQQKKAVPNNGPTPTATFYQNLILGGDYPDPSLLREKDTYYMTHSSFEYYPGLLIWKSKDLVNWERVTYALKQNVGSVWAPDLIKHKDTYYIYFPANKTNWVVTAKSPEGPWSAPVDLKLPGFIDPGHVVDKDGKRYLYLSKGYIIQLSDDGLSTVGEPLPGYQGWQFPKEWNTECFCLESPKSTVRNGYYYQTVAEGGTAGPATSHMVVSGRSRSPKGPWENSPYNPIVHTESRAERWWSQGHGTLVDDVSGKWWIMYHAYEKHFQTLGRQTLMLPIEWTKDNWFRVPEGVKSTDSIVKPAGTPSAKKDDLSDSFSGDELGLQWQGFKSHPSERAKVRKGKLELQAKGSSFENSSPLLVNTADRKYEIQVEYTIEAGTTAGLTLFYNEQGNMRISVDTAGFSVYNQKNKKITDRNNLGTHGYLRILNDENEISFYYSSDGKSWNRVERSIDATGFNHNIFGGFMSLRAGLFAFGEGKVVFDNFIYRKL
ncbi:family 43 glycosylhydrolase [Pedobacter sp. SYSU D00535]|uniref:family 43 glycosylhydrolase n=1 Tax=Pedobacter sp. SYSU D00535 TaxID=2810308 RepID=UPI001A960471|nr:family 43 glycosylhydrolase [Pedobacter sp. SYSU D00535]